MTELYKTTKELDPELRQRVLDAEKWSKRKRYQLWREIGKRFDWEYAAHRLESLARESQPLEPVEAQLYDINLQVLGVLHDSPLDGRINPHFYMIFKSEVDNLIGKTDNLLFEESLNGSYPQLANGKHLGDDSVIRRYGWGSRTLGVWRLCRALRGFDQQDPIHEINESKARLSALESEVFRGLPADRLRLMYGWVNEAQKLWPILFPDTEPLIAMSKRSRAQLDGIERSTTGSKGLRVGVVVGLSHMPQVLMAQERPDISAREMLYHLE